jgi:hypothetical protein
MDPRIQIRTKVSLIRNTAITIHNITNKDKYANHTYPRQGRLPHRRGLAAAYKKQAVGNRQYSETVLQQVKKE